MTPRVRPFLKFLPTLMLPFTVLAGCASTPGATAQSRTEVGKVVDATTGAAVPDALVVAVWRSEDAGVPGMISSSSTCLGQSAATTDGEGRFSLPTTTLAPAAAASTRKRLLVVYKAHYVRGNDLNVLPHHGTELFDWQFYPPETGGAASGHVELKHIELQPAALSAPDSWVYADAVLRTAHCEDRLGRTRNSPEFDRFAHTLRAQLRASPCALDPTTPVSTHAHASFGWALDDQQFMNRMKALEHFGSNEFKGTTAGTMCRALNEEKQE